MTEDDVHELMVKWIAGLTGVTVIQADQQGDEPTLPYIMVRLTGVAKVRDYAQETLYAEDAVSERILATPVIEREWRFSVHEFSTSPGDLLRLLSVADQIDQTLEPLVPVNLHDLSAVRMLPELINEKFEKRAQMDVTVRGLTKDGLLIDTIEQIETEFTRV